MIAPSASKFVPGIQVRSTHFLLPFLLSAAQLYANTHGSILKAAHGRKESSPESHALEFNKREGGGGGGEMKVHRIDLYNEIAQKWQWLGVLI